MRLARLAGVLLLCGHAVQARAEQVEGLVRSVGPAIDPETLITAEKELQGTKLCGSDVEKRIHQLAALFVKVEGTWKLKKNGERSCLVVTSFNVTKMNSGRAPAVGTLSENRGVYAVTGADGKAIAISDVPPGLKKLVGQKVLLDLKPADEHGPKLAEDMQETPKMVITYLAFP